MQDKAAPGSAAGRKIKAGFLHDPAAKAVLAALQTQKIEARFVGGCVRDALAGHPPTTGAVDLAAAAAPEAVMAALKQAGLKVLPTGLKHGTVSAHHAGGMVEITSLRRDVKTDGRHAEVSYEAGWGEDSARRDFTFNALYADAEGNIYDPQNGQADLAAGRVRFIGDAKARIAEDYLRILRFFRFFASHGAGAMDAEGLAAAGAAKAHLSGLSAERICAELLKLLAAARAQAALEAMQQAGILSLLIPGAENLACHARLCEIRAAHFLEADPLLGLGTLMKNHAQAQACAQTLRLSGAQTARLTAMFPARKPGEADPEIISYMSAREIRKFLYILGRQSFADRLLLGWAEDPHPRHDVQWRAALALAENWQRPVFPLTGAMMRQAGVPEGPEMGRVSREVEKWWIEADFISDVFSIIERLKAVVQATIY